MTTTDADLAPTFTCSKCDLSCERIDLESGNYCPDCSGQCYEIVLTATQLRHSCGFHTESPSKHERTRPTTDINNRKPSTLTGKEAIDHARAHGSTLSKYNDPIEGARTGLTPDEAEDVAREDASLIYLTTTEAATLLVAELDPSMSAEVLKKLEADGVSSTSIRGMLLELD